jgi:hypothetical protein
MHKFKLRFLDTIMGLVRREEARYQRYAVAPPELPPSKGLFGLASLPSPQETKTEGLFGTLAPKNALALVPKPSPWPWVHDELITQLKEDLSVVDHFAGLLEMRGSIDRVRLFEEAIAFMPTYEACHQEWRALRQHLEQDLKDRFVLYVGRASGAHLALMETDWAPTFVGFPSVRPEVERALECFAYEQFTACVFHTMRVAEQGLRAVAKERQIVLPKNRPIDDAEWGVLTTRLRGEGDKVTNWAPGKRGKKAAMAYYGSIYADIVYFKDRYRNIVSHSLSTFDEEDANRAVTRACDFMKTVSSRTDETGKRIAWK